MKLTSCYAALLVTGLECLFDDGPTTIQPSQKQADRRTAGNLGNLGSHSENLYTEK